MLNAKESGRLGGYCPFRSSENNESTMTASKIAFLHRLRRGTGSFMRKPCGCYVKAEMLAGGNGKRKDRKSTMIFSSSCHLWTGLFMETAGH